ncbi:SOS response-associated peptidase [Microbaculum sp. FT89]|uniref:SOS response-associated peptidase n=1 Tax=Microbaculum sp. FT89 TaxID=3447298 RepID=UPI003F53920C
MCGRYSLSLPPQEIRAFFGFPEQPNYPPRYNIAPTQPIAVVRLVHGQRSFALMRWGLLPSWLKDPKGFPTLINARGDTVATKPAFRGAMRHHRCLIPADGFYEWQKTDLGRKVPHLIRRPDRGPFAFAGLWETWLGADGSELDTATIVTTDANKTLMPLHDRMPVVVQPRDFDRWLDAEANAPKDVADILEPAPEDYFEAFPISTRVNSVANDDPAIQTPLAEATTPPAETRQAPKKPTKKADKDDGQMNLL